MKKVSIPRRKEPINRELGMFSYSSEPEVIDHLVPVGIGGFYKSPTEPVDPFDCVRWPESPFCGGDVLNDDFINLLPEFSRNPCETCVTLSPVLGKISLPPYTVCKRSNSPECVPKQLKPAPVNPDNPNLPGIGATPMDIDPTGLSGQCAGEPYIITLLGEVFGNFGDPEPYRYKATGNFIVTSTVRGPINGANLIEFFRDDDFGYSLYGLSLNHGGVISSIVNWNPPGESGYRPYIYNPSWFIKDGGYINLRWKISRLDGRAFDYCDDPRNEPINPPVPPPPYPDGNYCEEDCMACNGDSEELLRLIAKRLDTGSFPVKVPQSLLGDRGNGTESIESLTGLVFWFIKQFDAIAGQFPVEIEIKDTDPTKQGDQKEKVVIPNLAEGIAELLGSSLGTNINTNTLINICIRGMIESGSAKVEALKSRYISQAIADYLAFDAEETKTKVPLMFTPGKMNLDDILVEQEQDVGLYNYKDDRDFKGEMTELLFAASIIRAVHYKRVNPNSDVKGDLINRFKDLLKQAEEKDDRNDNTIKADFDDFIKQVEEGFINTPGIRDALNPYNRNFDQRPRIRELGNTSDESSENL